jgi:aspartyl-tRNA(Asn)/glutamyl-tRNA(Gln) amidotransferase subunit A
MISFSTRNAHEISELRIAVCETVFFEQCDPQIKEAVEAVAAKLRELGATISRVLVPEIEETLARTQEDVVMATEAYAVNRDLLENYREALDPDCFWMEAGKNINGAEYYDAVRQRYHLQRRTRERLVGVDAILAPTTAHPAWPMGDTGTDRPPISYLRNTGIGNYLNLPSVSIPCGFTDKGLPVGVMISGKSFDDEVVLRIANAFQQATDWQDRTADLSWTG